MVEIVSPRMFRMLENLYPDICTIQEVTETQSATGHPEKSWSNLDDHVDVPCRLSPIGGTERKTATQVYSIASHAIELTEPYPDIVPKMRVVVNEQMFFDILLVERDGQGVSSRLVVQAIV